MSIKKYQLKHNKLLKTYDVSKKRTIEIINIATYRGASGKKRGFMHNPDSI